MPCSKLGCERHPLKVSEEEVPAVPVVGEVVG